MAEASQPDHNSLSLTTGSEVTFDIVCTPCDNDGDINEADRYCLDCKEYLCTTCLKCHKKTSASKHHTLVDKDNIPGTLHVSDGCTQRCQTHQDQIIQFYCPSHKKLGCGVCMILTHDTCKGKLHIPDEAKTLVDSTEFKDFQALLEKLRKSSDVIIKSSKANIDTSAVYRIAALQEIETFRQETNITLNEMKAALQDQIQDITTRDEESMNVVKDKTSTVNVELQQLSSEFDTLLSKGQHCQMFIEIKSTEDKLAILQHRLEEAETRRIKTFRFKPNENLKKLMAAKDVLGELHVVNPMETSATHIADINVKSVDDKAKCWAIGAALLSKEKLVIADWDNKTVKLIDTELKRVISEYKPEQPPSDVTRINNDSIAITLPAAKKIAFMRLEDRLNPDNEICVDKQCFYIEHIDGKLVVSFCDNEVRLLSIVGETLLTFPTSSMEEPLFSSKPRVTVSPLTQAIYASDRGGNNLIMLDMDGNIIAQYKDDALKNPTYSAVDEMGMVHVCGSESNNILLLTPHCSKVKILLTERDGIKVPTSLCYCKDTRRLYIGMHANDTIKVYQLS